MRSLLLVGLILLTSCSSNILGSFRSIANEEEKIISEDDKRLNDFYLENKEFLNSFHLLVEEFLSSKHKYINQNYRDEFDKAAIKYQKLLDKNSELEQQLLLNYEGDELLKDGLKFAFGKIRIDLRNEFLDSINNGYILVKFYNEGSLDNFYEKNFYRNEFNQLKKEVDELKKNQEIELSLDIAEGETKFSEKQVKLLMAISNISKTIHIPSKKNLSQLRKNYNSWLEEFGNQVASAIVNLLGQIMKKRENIIYIRLESNFRGNYLFENKDQVIETLLKHGLKPGDILLEKDLQANSDFIIPGYWLHASAYLGTIKQFKLMNLWDRPEFAKIQDDIVSYQVDADKKRFLAKTLKNKYDFEDIPWFIESDRPGVGVHPLMKFLMTDGMVVLRPTIDWNEDAVINTIKTFNKYIHMPYDYTHNVKNKESVTCSKLILHVYNGITFPTSVNLNYVSVSPDQIGTPVQSSPDALDGQLKVIMFYDAEKNGALTYDQTDEQSYPFYQDYLQTVGLAQKASSNSVETNQLNDISGK